MYLISSCLAGVRCRYDGSHNRVEEIVEFMKERPCITACPEILGGLETPRVPCEIVNVEGEERVMAMDGSDCTENFSQGARGTLELCRLNGVTRAVLKQRSPSCGFGLIYDGTFSCKLKEGSGFTAALLHENGIKIYNEDNWKELLND